MSGGKRKWPVVSVCVVLGITDHSSSAPQIALPRCRFRFWLSFLFSINSVPHQINMSWMLCPWSFCCHKRWKRHACCVPSNVILDMHLIMHEHIIDFLFAEAARWWERHRKLEQFDAPTASKRPSNQQWEQNKSWWQILFFMPWSCFWDCDPWRPHNVFCEWNEQATVDRTLIVLWLQSFFWCTGHMSLLQRFWQDAQSCLSVSWCHMACLWSNNHCESTKSFGTGKTKKNPSENHSWLMISLELMVAICIHSFLWIHLAVSAWLSFCWCHEPIHLLFNSGRLQRSRPRVGSRACLKCGMCRWRCVVQAKIRTQLAPLLMFEVVWKNSVIVPLLCQCSDPNAGQVCVCRQHMHMHTLDHCSVHVAACVNLNSKAR